MDQSAIRVSAEVQSALHDNRPIIALESTIFTHGLPRPRNVDVAQQAIAIARENGVVPATIGVVNGTATVGLSDSEIAELGSSDTAEKVSVRELCTAAVSRSHGGTTIASTALIAHRAGLTVFSTGGMGGVHHGAATSFDESADLTTLSRVPMLVVSSGAKAILDIPATLERFETLSIPVVGYQTRRYPGFYVADSGFDITASIDSPAQAAELFQAQARLGIDASIHIANPIPAHQQLDPNELDSVLDDAWAAASEQGIRGQETTPFLLDFIQQRTDGRSLDANVALYLSNVRLGSRIASALAG